MARVKKRQDKEAEKTKRQEAPLARKANATATARSILDDLGPNGVAVLARMFDGDADRYDDIYSALQDELRKRRSAPKVIKQYQHRFRHGTCHLLPPGDDYESPAWVQWRADHPHDWAWRDREVDDRGCLVGDKRTPPWLNPDGTKWRPINSDSAEGRRILAGLKNGEAA